MLARARAIKSCRFTAGSGWLQGTQVFLEVGPRTGGAARSSNKASKASVDASAGETAAVDEGGDAAQVSITVSKHQGNGEGRMKWHQAYSSRDTAVRNKKAGRGAPRQSGVAPIFVYL